MISQEVWWWYKERVNQDIQIMVLQNRKYVQASVLNISRLLLKGGG